MSNGKIFKYMTKTKYGCIIYKSYYSMKLMNGVTVNPLSWSIDNHIKFDMYTRYIIKTFLMCNKYGNLHKINKYLIHIILNMFVQ